jgi:chromosome segregation ATPase
MFASEKYVDEQIYRSKIILDGKDNDIVREIDDLKKQIEYNNTHLQNAMRMQFSELNIRISNIEAKQELINENIESLKVDIEVLSHEKQDMSVVFDKITELDNQTLDHFKIVHDTISKLSEIIMLPKSEKPNVKSTAQNHLIDYKKLEEKHEALSLKLDTAIDMVFEKIANNESPDDEDLPPQLSSDKCPFKKKQGFCELWANRKNKKDALVYCSSCMQVSELLDKGVKL